MEEGSSISDQAVGLFADVIICAIGAVVFLRELCNNI